MDFIQGISFKEDHISQIPALQMLQKIGYEYLTPDEALAMRGGKLSAVLLEDVLRNQLRRINSIRVNRNKEELFSEQNIDNYIHYFTQYPQIPEDEIPRLENVQEFLGTDLIQSTGANDFEEFIASEIDPVFPIGMTFEDWYNKAVEVDGIPDDEKIDISDTATSYLNKDLADRPVLN